MTWGDATGVGSIGSGLDSPMQQPPFQTRKPRATHDYS